MKLAAKREPEPGPLRDAREEGFDHVELYLERAHLDDLASSKEACTEADIDVVSLHTPHVCKDEEKYIKRSFEMAASLGCLVVFHSTGIFINDAIAIGETFDHPAIAYEHDPGFSVQGINNLVLDRGKDLVLDVAHLYIGSDRYVNDLAYLLERARHIHLCDSSSTVDGLPLGEGELDIERTVGMIEQSSFDGHVVVEVMPEHQQKAKKLVEQILDR